MVPSEDEIFKALKKKVETDLENGLTLNSSMHTLFRVYTVLWLQVHKDERSLLKKRYKNAVTRYNEYVRMLHLIGALHDN